MQEHDKKAMQIAEDEYAWESTGSDLSDENKEQLSDQLKLRDSSTTDTKSDNENSSSDNNDKKTLFERKNLDEKLRNIT